MPSQSIEKCPGLLVGLTAEQAVHVIRTIRAGKVAILGESYGAECALYVDAGGDAERTVLIAEQVGQKRLGKGHMHGWIDLKPTDTNDSEVEIGVEAVARNHGIMAALVVLAAEYEKQNS